MSEMVPFGSGLARRESWAIYRASRAIHDQTNVALQEMLDAARAHNSERP